LTDNQTAFQGINNPPIDELLTKTDSKYRLVLFAAKRARQINSYYSQLGEGLLEHVGPLVETGVQEKPLSIALREVNAGVLQCIETDGEDDATGKERAGLTAVEDIPAGFDDTEPGA
jgi:DNA-directed RNA polymerase subunit omega